MKKNPKISVIIPTYNRKDLLFKCLKSLFVQNYPSDRYEIIVADDGSSDGTGDLVKSLKPKCNLVYVRQENKGRGVVRNFGVKHATGEILAFTDDDCIVDKNWIKNAVPAFSNAMVGGVTGRTSCDIKDITPLTRPVISEGGHQTCNIFYRKKVFDDVGGFKLGQFREDTELAYRVLEAGYIMKFNESVSVEHPATRYTIKGLVKKHLSLEKGYWDMYLAKHYPKRFRKDIAIAKYFSPGIFMNYPFYLSTAFSVFSFFKFSSEVFLTSLILLIYVYLSSVLIQTNELCRGGTFRQMARYKKELLQISSVWWMVMFTDLFFHIKGMLHFRVFSL